MNDSEHLAKLESTVANLGQMVLDQAEEIRELRELRAELESVRTIAEVALKNVGR